MTPELAALKNEYFWYLADDEGTLYEFAVEEEPIVSAAASARTLLESCAVLGALTNESFAEATLSADVANEIVEHLGLQRVEEASDRFREFWLGDAGGGVRIRPLFGYPAQTLICVRDDQKLVQTVRLALQLAPSAHISRSCGGRAVVLSGRFCTLHRDQKKPESLIVMKPKEFVMIMKALVVGGTGVVSTGIVQQLLARGVQVSVFNRGLRSSSAGEGVRLIRGDRSNASDFARTFEHERFDVVYDMICYTAEHAEATAHAFAGRCEQLVLCSSAIVYGPKMPPSVLIDERAPLEPTSHWGKSKIACEQALTNAAERGAFKLTIARLGHTYGPGDSMNDQQDNDGLAWDRVVRGLPVFCTGDGLGLWQSTHRDDTAKFFAGAAMAPQTYGQTFNVMRDEVLTWRDYYREVARALDTRANLIFVPASWLIAQDSERFSFLSELSQFHAAYSSAKAKAAVPEFRATITLEAGARETFADMRRRGLWPDGSSDTAYQALVDRALAMGFRVEEA